MAKMQLASDIDETTTRNDPDCDVDGECGKFSYTPEHFTQWLKSQPWKTEPEG